MVFDVFDYFCIGDGCCIVWCVVYYVGVVVRVDVMVFVVFDGGSDCGYCGLFCCVCCVGF